MSNIIYKYNIEIVSEYVLAKCTELGTPISNLQLQKFLYYVQGYNYRKFSEPAFKEDFYSWMYGPVSPDAYYKYCSYIRRPIEKNADNVFKSLIFQDKQTKIMIDNVINCCLQYSPSKLVNMTLDEYPCKSTEILEIIQKDKIKNFFQNINPLNLQFD